MLNESAPKGQHQGELIRVDNRIVGSIDNAAARRAIPKCPDVVNDVRSGSEPSFGECG